MLAQYTQDLSDLMLAEAFSQMESNPGVLQDGNMPLDPEFCVMYWDLVTKFKASILAKAYEQAKGNSYAVARLINVNRTTILNMSKHLARDSARVIGPNKVINKDYKTRRKTK